VALPNCWKILSKLSKVGEMAPCEYEAALIRRCKEGDKGEFHLLVAPHLPSITRLAYSILRCKQGAEDVAQETVLKAMAHIEQLREGDSFRAWLLQIAANEARMRLRKWGRRSVSVESEIQQRRSQLSQLVESRNIPSSQLEQREMRAALVQALSNLNETYRTVFILRDVQRLSSAEAAKILGISERPIDTKLHRARRKMRERLTNFFRATGNQFLD